ncbi:hypothetical protein BN1723_006219 [Verticillium longisporum]|uniref:Uncharacterized protein n=2 Tax=Verticillium TaxID=1036719 RepID=G2X3B4_VERDV|nr:uncharacterized protein VDAG_04899 [Verticillium dahliae VdLs.17]EGY23461.1 hypothetical protein VDAG_04899 [Verticillium dahliae VdLs.17]KAG7152804.1 hypothetical protein HYQ46_005511 [Verticillium longisporum]CRK11301.1 hypothetical protein BN1708_010107 [Verticillium longisporum]CRK44626.1 hypothetical protein BN1723_006219 [Verticillium longisporum]
MDTPLKVRRKRRGLSLYNKIFEYGELFDMNITIIAQERASGDYEVFQPVRNDNWPPAMRDIRPEILHTGRPITPKCGRGRQSKLRKIEKLLQQRKVPKPPKIQKIERGVEEISLDRA